VYTETIRRRKRTALAFCPDDEGLIIYYVASKSQQPIWVSRRINRPNSRALSNIYYCRRSPCGVMIYCRFADYLHVGDYNVICVYWTSVLPGDTYEKAVLRVRPIGYGLAGFIEKLTNDTQNGFENIHLIGHSLGAHIVGFAGKKLNGRVPRITGKSYANRVTNENDFSLTTCSLGYHTGMSYLSNVSSRCPVRFLQSMILSEIDIHR